MCKTVCIVQKAKQTVAKGSQWAMAVKSSIAAHSKGLLSLFILLNLFVTHKCANQHTHTHTPKHTDNHIHKLAAGGKKMKT